MSAVNRWAVAVALGAVCAGCSGGNTSSSTTTTAPPAKEVVTNNSMVMQLSRPDEAAKALASVAQPDDWKQVLETGTAVAGSDKLQIAAAIGMQSANGVVAEYAGDDATAQKLAASVKGLADRLSLSSAQLESLVAKAASDAKEPDAAKRSGLVRDDLVQIQDELKATFDKMGDGGSATMMLFGAWVEGVRMASTLLQKKYDATASDVLNRRGEADHFLATLRGLPTNASPLYAQLTPPLVRIRDAMVVDKSRQVSQKSVVVIQAAATELAGLLRK